MTTQCGNITGDDLFNASNGMPIKVAGRDKMSVDMTGFAIILKVDDETGEANTTAVIKTKDGHLIAGGSKVIVNRLEELVAYKGKEILDKESMKITFAEITTKNGIGVSFSIG